MVRLFGMPASATVDLNKLSNNDSDPITVATTATDITTTLVSTTTDEGVFEAIVAPHAGAGNFAGREVLVTSNDGLLWTHTIPDSFTFEAGMVYTFRLVLITKDIPITTQTVTGTLDGLTNAYMVVPGSGVGFMVSRAYKYEVSAFTDNLRTTNAGYTGKFAADIVWADANVIYAPFVQGSGEEP
jgi:hypothetical protein